MKLSLNPKDKKALAAWKRKHLPTKTRNKKVIVLPQGMTGAEYEQLRTSRAL